LTWGLLGVNNGAARARVDISRDVAMHKARAVPEEDLS
jgi:hypothetical protein